MFEKYYITTPIFYPNGVPHIGHAYNVLAADSPARFYRLSGADVFFLSGTDEHGRKMQQTAKEMGIEPQALADKNSGIFRSMLEKLAVSNDDFLRTTEARHHKACQALWRKMEKAGDIYLGSYAGWYSVRQEAYYDEKDTELGADGVRREKEVGSPVIWNEEESYFFRLSRYQGKLLKLYEENSHFIGPEERRNEIISFVRSGLRDLSISRTSFNWGVKVPGNPKHVMYVWVDALTNYLTGLGYPDENAPALRKFWPADAHIIGKDIIRFHAVYWPAFLMSAGIAVPHHVFAHGFLLNRGEKMSKSVGNVIDPFVLTDKFGRDAVRYFFLREIPFGQDGIFDDKAIMNRVNADLANDLGNLAQRSLSMIAKNCGGIVPKPAVLNAEDKALPAKAEAALAEIKAAMSEFAPHRALSTVFAVISEANRYFAGQEPWKLRKTDEQRFAAVLYTAAETVRRAALLLLPFIPDSAHKFLDLLAVPADKRQFKHLGQALQSGIKLPAPQPVFPRLQAEEGEASD